MKKLEFLKGDVSFNKIGKDRFLILLICGMLLLVMAIPVNSSEQKNNLSKGGTTEAVTKTTGVQQNGTELAQINDMYNMDYSRYMEMRLSEILSSVEGAGSVKVLVTIKKSETQVVEKDNPYERKTVYETGAEGEDNNTIELANDIATVYTEDENGHKIPFVSTRIQPQVEGVLVVAQGGGNEEIKNQIIEAIQALFDVESHKIKVVKMKGEN